MGLYYQSFLKEMKKEYNKQNTDVESFLKSKEVNNIYNEYEVGEGSVHWALNIVEFYRENNIHPTKTYDKAEECLNDDLKNENGMF